MTFKMSFSLFFSVKRCRADGQLSCDIMWSELLKLVRTKLILVAINARFARMCYSCCQHVWVQKYGLNLVIY